MNEIHAEAVFRQLAEKGIRLFAHAREIQMLLGKDEDRHARAENVEVVVVIKGGIWRALRSGENGGSDDGEKKGGYADAVENDLFSAAEVPPAEIIPADKINGEAEREKAIGVHDDRADDGACLMRNEGGEQGKLGRRKVKRNASSRK